MNEDAQYPEDMIDPIRNVDRLSNGLSNAVTPSSVALAQHPGATIVKKGEGKRAGVRVHEFELQGAAGERWSVVLHPETLEVLDDRQVK